MKEDYRHVLKSEEDGTLEPYILYPAAGGIFNYTVVDVLVDGKPLLSTDILRALLILIGVFFIFNIIKCLAVF